MESYLFLAQYTYVTIQHPINFPMFPLFWCNCLYSVVFMIFYPGLIHNKVTFKLLGFHFLSLPLTCLSEGDKCTNAFHL